MTDIQVAQRRIERTFRKTFTTENVAEPLLSFDEELPCRRAPHVLDRRRERLAKASERRRSDAPLQM